MANPTDRVKNSEITYIEVASYQPLVTTAQTYYPGEHLGYTAEGLITKYDDSASLGFAGIMGESARKEVDSSTTADELKILIKRPRRFSVAVAVAARTDIGKALYASDSDKGQYAATTYGNLIGRVCEYIDSTTVDVWPIYYGESTAPGWASRTMAATGNETITKFDLNKTILVPNTAAKTLTLPAIADCPRGSRLEFVKTTSDAAAITLDANASETIDGGATLATLDAANDTAILVSTGTAWVVLSRDIT